MIKDPIDFAGFANPWSRKFYSQKRESIRIHGLSLAPNWKTQILHPRFWWSCGCIRIHGPKSM